LKQRADARIFPASFDDVTVTQTPEPNSALLLGAGVLLLGSFGVFYKRKQALQDVA
jgi:LPXTG-motif cell wall-anchored protein